MNDSYKEKDMIFTIEKTELIFILFLGFLTLHMSNPLDKVTYISGASLLLALSIPPSNNPSSTSGGPGGRLTILSVYFVTQKVA